MEGDKPKKKRFADCPIGYVHVDIAEVRTEQGKLYLFVVIDRTSKLAFVNLEAEANRYTASDFLRALVAFVPYKIHTVLTDNGAQFCHAPRNRSGPTALYSRHMFDRVCHEHGIEHRVTKPNHPWTNGQVERMNRTIEDATVKRYHYETHEQLRAHLQLFVDAYNYARRLKTLRGLTPYEHVLQVWTKEPERFRIDPSHLIPGPYTGGRDQPAGRLFSPVGPLSGWPMTECRSPGVDQSTSPPLVLPKANSRTRAPPGKLVPRSFRRGRGVSSDRNRRSPGSRRSDALRRCERPCDRSR